MAENDDKSESPAKPEVVNTLEAIDDWSFDIFTLAKLSHNKPLNLIANHLFTRYGIIATFKITPLTLENFINQIEEGYMRFKNPYHNNLHACDVTQTIHFMLCKTGLINWMTNLEIFATILSAIIHDYEHSGYTNNFLVLTGSERALIYNDRSVQENHHISAAFFILKEDDSNILSNLTKEEYRNFRKLVIDMILATDMAFHFQLLKDMKNRITLPELTVNKTKALGLLLHTCDISNASKDWHLHRQWSTMLSDEFFRQGDRERELCLPISPLCDRNNTKIPESQIHFIDFVLEPTLSLFADMVEFVLEPIDPLDNANTNLVKINDTPNEERVLRKPHIPKPWVECMSENKRKWRELAFEAQKLVGIKSVHRSSHLEFEDVCRSVDLL